MALEANLQNTRAHSPLGLLLLDDQPEPAAAAFAAAFTLDARATYAIVLQKMNAYEDTVPHFHRAILIDQQQSAEFYGALGATLTALGMHDRAEIAFNHARALDRTP